MFRHVRCELSGYFLIFTIKIINKLDSEADSQPLPCLSVVICPYEWLMMNGSIVSDVYLSLSLSLCLSASPLWEMVQEGIDLKSIKWSQH